MEIELILSSLAVSGSIFIALGAKGHVRLAPGMFWAIASSLISAYVVFRLFGPLENASLVRLFLVEIGVNGLLIGVAIAFMFYRDPERVPERADGSVVSPADGVVRYVNRFEAGETPVSDKKRRKFRLSELADAGLGNGEGHQIGIEMNLFDVHVNRAPVAGRVVLLKPIRGSFSSLRDPAAVFRNERFTTLIDNGDFSVAVVQIASRLVRKIVSYLEEGQMVDLGQRIGVIRFGSQVDLIIPDLESLSISVKPGDKVFAGRSEIARYALNIEQGKGSDDVSVIDGVGPDIGMVSG
ncbi:MAG: phosphatidylserine decarboxylase [Actinobacteria bacterium]|nr:phosphatidylserine decarboxylase [Actinomycetota bacterium]